jgi:voltage-gated potassium channel
MTDAAAPPASHTEPTTLRRRVYEVLEGAKDGDRTADLFDKVLITLIILNVAAFMAETVPSIEQRYGMWLDIFETVSVGLFTLEYALRVWSAPEVPYLRRQASWQARFAWARRPYLAIDLLAILPFYMHHIFGLDLRVMRLLRVLRLLKLSRYSPAMHTLARVIYGERRALIGAAYLLAAAVIFAATGIYYFEHEVQPDKFGSVPESAWWAIATLTTVGYGDVVPVTPWGKAFGGIVMVTGLCILALPVAIISTGFAQEAGRRDFVVNWSLMSRVPALANLDAFQVAEVMPLFHAHNMPPRAEVIARGTSGEAMYFIAAGQVRFVSDVMEKTFCTGEFFGVAAMINNDVHYGSFYTIGRCRLLKLYKEDFRRLEHIAPEVARGLRAAAAERIDIRLGLIATKSSALKDTQASDLT